MATIFEGNEDLVEARVLLTWLTVNLPPIATAQEAAIARAVFVAGINARVVLDRIAALQARPVTLCSGCGGFGAVFVAAGDTHGGGKVAMDAVFDCDRCDTSGLAAEGDSDAWPVLSPAAVLDELRGYESGPDLER